MNLFQSKLFSVNGFYRQKNDSTIHKVKKLRERGFTMNYKEKEVGVFFGSLILMLVGMVYTGFVTTKLWNGIISSTFGLDQLRFFQGLGLDLFITYLFYSSGISGRDKSESIFALVIELTILTTVFWGVGSLITLFI